jgi:hypothetical protein
VAEYTPLLLRLRSKIWYDTFDGIAASLQWTLHGDGKECADFQGDVWSDQGWTRVRRFIRHAAPATLTRIVTSAGLVDVTSSEVFIGTELKHNSLPDFGCPSLKDKAVMIFRSPRIDTRALRAPYHVRKSLWKSLYQPNLIFRISNQLDAAMLVALGDSLGYSYTFEFAADRPETIFISFSKDMIANRTRIIDMQTIAYSGTYVYDCTTENHHFAAGPGLLVVSW